MKAAAIRGGTNLPAVLTTNTAVAANPAAIQEQANPVTLCGMRALVENYPLSSFVALTFALSWIPWLVLLTTGMSYESRLWRLLYVAGLSGPLVASTGMALVTGGRQAVWRFLEKGCIWSFAPTWYMVAIMLPPILMFTALGANRLITGTAVEVSWVGPGTFVVLLLRMIVQGGPANEEFGWRGFLLAQLLERHSPFLATGILIPIWGAWHLPLWHLRGLPHPYWPLPFFLMILAALAFLFTWLHLRTKGSVLAAILFHGSINTWLQLLPMLPPRHLGLLPFGLWIGITWAVALIILWAGRTCWFARQ